MTLAWLRRVFAAYFETQLDPQKPAIWVGDLNVAPEPIDVYHPERRVNDVDFHIDVRTAYKEAVWLGIHRRLSKAPSRIVRTVYLLGFLSKSV